MASAYSRTADGLGANIRVPHREQKAAPCWVSLPHWGHLIARPPLPPPRESRRCDYDDARRIASTRRELAAIHMVVVIVVYEIRIIRNQQRTVCVSQMRRRRRAHGRRQAGFESVWTGEHVILPDPQAPPSPVRAGLSDARSRRSRWHSSRRIRRRFASAPASSYCRSAIRWCSPRNSPRPTCCRTGG